MRRIPLSKGKEALVDDQDYDYLMEWRWCFDGRYAVRYGYRRGVRTSILMHKVVAVRKRLTGEIDHRNQHKLDNRRRNLRLATGSQNMANCSLRSNNKSGFKGVSWDKSCQQWQAGIGLDGKRKHLGRFPPTSVGKKVAARAYNRAAKAHFGKYAYLNKV